MKWAEAAVAHAHGEARQGPQRRRQPKSGLGAILPHGLWKESTLDFALLASRTGREFISIVLNPPCVAMGCGSPRK